MWSDERTADLRHYAARGWSASQIGNRLGVSRNAVIGKCDRIGVQLGLGNRSAPLTDIERKARKAARDAKRRFYPSRRPRTMQISPKRTPAPANAPLSKNLPIWQLRAGECHYATSPDDAPIGGHLFCGAATDGGAYCPYHHRMAYQPWRLRIPQLANPPFGLAP